MPFIPGLRKKILALLGAYREGDGPERVPGVWLCRACRGLPSPIRRVVAKRTVAIRSPLSFADGENGFDVAMRPHRGRDSSRS